MPCHTVKTLGLKFCLVRLADLLNLRTRARRVSSNFSQMRHTPRFSNAPGNKVAACVCLLAVFLLWAPLWATAFHAADMACCDGAMCPLHRHMPKKGTHEQAPPKEKSSTCEHHSKSAAMDCTIACCQSADSTITQAIVFVLPTPPVISTPLLTGISTTGVPVSVNSPSFDPASPPPRVPLLHL